MSKSYMVVQTHSYDGESVDEVTMLDGPFYKKEEAMSAFKKFADEYEGYDDASVDDDHVVHYDGQDGIYNILIMEF